MIKLMGAWKYRKDITPEECEAHYRAVHMALAREAFTDAPGFQALLYNRVDTCRVVDFDGRQAHDVEPPFDGFIELTFDTAEQMLSAMQSEVLERMHVDHANFMDLTRPASIMQFELDETVVLRRP